MSIVQSTTPESPISPLSLSQNRCILFQQEPLYVGHQICEGNPGTDNPTVAGVSNSSSRSLAVRWLA